MHSCLTEFNEEVYRKGIYEEAIIKFLHKLQSKNFSKEEAINQIMEYFDLSNEEAAKLTNANWK